MAAKSEVYLIDKPGALQSVIVAGNVAPPRANPDEIAIEAMNDALGGTFGGAHQHEPARGQTLVVWSADSFCAMRGRSARIYAIAPVQTDKTKESLEEMNKEFRGIVGDHPVGEAELKKIQANETLKVPGSRETLDELQQAIMDIVQFGLPDDYYETYGPKVSALQLSDVNGAVKEIVRPDNLIWVVVGDRAKIESGVKELNLGEFHLMSADGKVM